jgi:hypothetical protein
MDKEIKKIVRELESEGWVKQDGKKHLKFRHPNSKKTLVMSRTPSCHHAYMNIRKQAERYLRENNEEKACPDLR